MKLGTGLAAALGAALLVGLGVQTCRLQQARAAAYDADTSRTNAAARAEATIRRLVTVHGQQLAVAERGVVQERLRADNVTTQLAGAEDELTTTRAQISLLGAELSRLRSSGTTLAGPDSAGRRDLSIVDSLDARDSLGITATARVTVPRLPLPADYVAPRATWDWTLRRETAHVTLELLCRTDSRTAHIRAVGPPWLPLDFTDVRQDERICAPPPARWDPFRLALPSLPVIGGLLLVGGVVGVLIAN